jgi:hypothetical protein
MDQLRTTTAQLSAHQRSTTDSSQQWCTLQPWRPDLGSRAMSSWVVAATAMILPSLMILCSRSLVLVSLPSCAAEGTSRRRNHA